MKIGIIIQSSMRMMKTIWSFRTSLLIIIIFSLAIDTRAQTKSNSAKDYCTMKDGKMRQITSEKMLPMDRTTTMKNGTKCKTTGECVLMNGLKMKMKEGECIDTDGNMAKSPKELNVRTKLNPRKKKPWLPVPSTPFMKLRVASLEKGLNGAWIYV